jgi:hypothetical protein
MSNDGGGINDKEAKGKYFLIYVPDFDLDPITGQPMSSYLRLGASSTTWQEAKEGGDLAALISKAGPPPDPPYGPFDPGAPENPGGGVYTYPRDSREHPFIDDERVRDPGEEQHLTRADRKAQSNILHTRGGWRDHSDGNRISTTRGDKIEIIRGNYKMVVLGRQDDPGTATGWDASGGHIQDFGATMPGASVTVDYELDQYEGVWHLKNTTENVRQSSRFAGTFKEEKWGEIFEAFIGWDDPASTDDPKRMCDVEGTKYPRGNPHIYEKTFASKKTSITGSSKTRIPIIKEELWVKDTTSYTNAESITEETVCSGTISSKTDAKKIEEKTDADETITTTTTAAAITDTTTAAAITETTTSGAITSTTTSATQLDLNLIGAAAEISVGGVKLGIDLVGQITELAVALNKISVEIGTVLEFFIGFKRGWVIGSAEEYNIPEKKEVTPQVTNIHITQTRIAVSYKVLAVQQNLTAVQVNIGV